jgi:HSP20 family molecular chaperone IbpA|nr:MAG TPA: hypothetical protein [Caudoviricetes sp.]
MLSFLFNPFLWNKDVYKFNRFEKDMNPFSVHEKGNKVILVHNVVGINKEDLKVKIINDNNISKLVISGETKNKETESDYSIHSEFVLDKNKKIKDISSKTENGLLYITIEYEKPEVKGDIQTIKVD